MEQVLENYPCDFLTAKMYGELNAQQRFILIVLLVTYEE